MNREDDFIIVNEKKAQCDGKIDGHPRVYFTLSNNAPNNIMQCYYCGRKFMYIPQKNN